MLTALLLVFGMGRAAVADDFDPDDDDVSVEATIAYVHNEIERTTTDDEVIRHVINLIEERSDGDDSPRFSGRLVLGFEGAGVAGMNQSVIGAGLKRILEDGEPFDDIQFSIDHDAWIGLSFRPAQEFMAAVNAAKLERMDQGHAEDDDLPEEAVQDLCEYILRAPVRH